MLLVNAFLNGVKMHLDEFVQVRKTSFLSKCERVFLSLSYVSTLTGRMDPNEFVIPTFSLTLA